MIRFQYILLQMCYWMLYCVGYSYVTLYLLGVGFSTGNVGVITATFGTLAALLQPNLGRLADQKSSMGWKPQMMIMSGICIADMVLLLLLPNKILQGLLFGLFLTLLSCMLPFTNSANFYYENRGISMKFGIARGLGSFFYAILSYLIGLFTANGTITYVPFCGLIVACCLFFIILSLPYGSRFENAHERKENEDTGSTEVDGEKDTLKGRQKSFLVRYPKFCITLVGFVLFLMFHNIANTYLLQMIERVGGTSKDYGAAIAFSAVLELPAMFGFAYLQKKFSMHFLLTFSAFSFAIKSIFYLISGNVAMIYITQIFQGTAFALFIPASVYFAEKTMKKEDKVKGQAWVTSSITVGAVLGNLLGGIWIDAFGMDSLLVAMTIVAVLGAFVVLFSTKDKMEKES